MNSWDQSEDLVRLVRKIDDLIKQLDLNMQQGSIALESLEQVGMTFMLIREKRNTLVGVRQLIVNSNEEIENGN